MRNAGFDGPGTIAGNFNTLLHGDREVLVPCDLPVRILVLIEINAANDLYVASENRFNECSALRTVRQFTSQRDNVEQVPDPKCFARSFTLDLLNFRSGEGVKKSVNGVGIKEILDNGKAIAGNTCNVIRLVLKLLHTKKQIRNADNAESVRVIEVGEQWLATFEEKCLTGPLDLSYTNQLALTDSSRMMRKNIR